MAACVILMVMSSFDLGIGFGTDFGVRSVRS
jgi:hypothetical protein